MTADEIDEKCKIAIGNLLHCACPLSKTVVTAFDHKASRTANTATLNSSRFKLESLEACAEFLSITLSDAESNKLFTKATLAPRLVDALFALLPSTCMECNDHYTVEREPEPAPFFTCYRCFQGSHSCELMKEKHEALSAIPLPTGMIWLCKRCHEATNPIQPRKSKSRHNSVSKSVQSLSRNTAATSSHHVESSLASSSSVQETPKHPLANLDSEQGRVHLQRRLSQHADNDGSPEFVNVCKKYKIGQCPHGLRGNKVVNGATCPNKHPKRCFKYCKHGTKDKEGCKKGTKCTYYHPVLCKFSVKGKQCSKVDCPYPHLAGTKRSGKETGKDTKKKSVSEGGKPEPAKVRKRPEELLIPQKPDSSINENHFLVLQKMVEDMGTKFQQEIQTLKANFYHLQFPNYMGNTQMKMSYPNQLHPQQSPMHQGYPAAWSTPRLSS
jgi:hypothetical protein